MTAKALWTKLVNEGTGQLENNGTTLIPKKEYKIKGDVIEKLIRNPDDSVTIIVRHVTVIDHLGENIDYSLYGTPKHSMGE